MNRSFTRTLMALALAAGLAPASLAQGGGPLVNRRVLSTAIMPGPSPTTRDVHVAWTVELGGLTTAPQNASLDALLVINQINTAQQPVSIQVTGGSGDCGSCSGGCGSGYIDGVFNNLLCLEEGTGPSAGCECRFPSVLLTFPGVPMQPGDEVMVLLVPAPGALPEADTSDDIDRHVFSGDPIGWDRKITSVEVTPSSGAPDSFFDIWVEVDFGTAGMSGALDLTPQAEVFVNGASAGVFDPPCGPWYATPGSSCVLCDGSICGTITCNGQVVTEMRCTPDDDLGCGCVSTSACLILVPGIQVEPGDVLDVVLQPKPGALPELPGFGDEEQDVGRWLDLGHALAGRYGDPVSLGDGTLLGGDPVSLTLINVLENTTAYLVVGVNQLSAPFKGGVMVPDPSPPGVFLPLPTGAGVIGLAGVWPLGFTSGFSTYMQWWIVDPAGPKGFAASNALVATTP